MQSYTLIAEALSSLAFTVFLIGYLASTNASTRRWTGLASILTALVTCLLSLLPIQEKVRLGLDLKGGTSFTIELETKPGEAAVSEQTLAKAVEVIRKRVDKFGLSEPIIQPMGTNRISVQIPGLKEEDKNAARNQLGQVAKLEFRIVHPDSAAEIQRASQPGQTLPFGYEKLPLKPVVVNGKEVSRGEVLVEKRVALSGKYVTKAFRSQDQLALPQVAIEFNDEGKKLFGELTTKYVRRQMAIVLDGEVQSYPNINEPILGGSCTISGGSMTVKEAEDLASVLENPLESPVKILEERGVDPSLGTDSIKSGGNAALYAFLGVVVFMIGYYHFAGAVSVIALIINLVLLLGLLAQFQFTLTLPGIAGIVLTIGMAVDANVLIYERMRDELKLGRPLDGAIHAGFDRAFSAIFDSNVTTLIPALVLSFLGTGPLQGFAVTLMLGIVANLFAALVVTRNCFEWIQAYSPLQKLTMMKFLEDPKFDFLRWKIPAAVLSFVLLLAGMGSFTVNRSQLLGVDFTGGDALTLQFKNRIEVASLRSELEKNGLRPGSIQYFTATAGQKDKLLVQVREHEGEKAVQTLRAAFPDAGIEQSGLDRVGSQVGSELQERAIISLALGILGILIYSAFRFEWSFAIAAAIGQVHDVFLALSLMALLGRELTLPLVAAFLTIAGYSINDKIVVFDRIREGLQLREKGSFYQIINRALNLTLARTLMTGNTMILATLALIVFGGPVIHDFSIAMLIGILSGIYSSHFISPPIAWWLGRKKQGEPEGTTVLEPKIV